LLRSEISLTLTRVTLALFVRDVKFSFLTLMEAAFAIPILVAKLMFDSDESYFSTFRPRCQISFFDSDWKLLSQFPFLSPNLCLTLTGVILALFFLLSNSVFVPTFLTLGPKKPFYHLFRERLKFVSCLPVLSGETSLLFLSGSRSCSLANHCSPQMSSGQGL
jgi:hypothetical protein